jgi:UDP-glucose 4-epimerase
LYNGKNVSSEVINLGSSVGYSIQEAVDAFVAVTGYNNVQYTEARHEVETAVCNVSKSERLLDWNLYGTTTRLKDGIDAMWEWAKQQPERPLQSMPPLEVTVNAHSSLKS